MSTAAPTAREDQTDATPETARRCLVTDAMRPKDELIRFVVAPDNFIVPDLAHNLPGRGLWVSAEREAITTAAAKGLFAKAAKAKVKAGADLADQTAQLLKKRLLDMLGLAKGAGIAVLGQPQVEAALRASQIKLLFIAEDAAAAGLGKINPGPLTPVRSLTRQELGAALGYEQVVYMGLKAHSLGEKIRLTLGHLENIAGKSHVSVGTDSGKQ